MARSRKTGTPPDDAGHHDTGNRSDGTGKAQQVRHSSRRPSQATLTATGFALSTLTTLVVLIIAMEVASPLPLRLRILPSVEFPFRLPEPPSDASPVTAVVTSLVALYATSRLTRNATLESDRVSSESLRHAWIAFFEAIWCPLFVVTSESLAASMEPLLDGRGVTPSVLVAPITSWAVSVAAITLRCLLARHDHRTRHAACEALRAVGISSVVCLSWTTLSLVIVSHGTESDPVPAAGQTPPWLTPPLASAVALGTTMLVLLLVIRPCMTEGRHRRSARQS